MAAIGVVFFVDMFFVVGPPAFWVTASRMRAFNIAMAVLLVVSMLPIALAG